MKVTSEDLAQNFDQIADQAITEPVTITSDGQDRLMLLSEDEYMRLKRRDRQAYRIDELPDEWAAAIRTSNPPPPEAASYNHEYPSEPDK